MIKKLYIMQSTGQCISYFDFNSIDLELSKEEKKQSDPQLISGFFAALFAFAEGYVGQNDPLRMIWMASCKLHFYRQGNFIYILETDLANQNLHDADYRAIMDEISTYFYKNFISKAQGGEFITIVQDAALTEQIRDILAKTIRKQFFMKIQAKSHSTIEA